MRTLITTIFLLIFAASFGQTKSYYNIVDSNGDTTFWYKYQTKQIKKLSLPLLNTVSNSIFFRVWTNKQVIEIFQNQTGALSGKLITWIDEYAPYNEKPTNRTFIKEKALTGDTANLVRQLFLSSGILILPTDDSIKGWQHGFDGITYFIEYSTKDNYYFKSYWTPKAQDSLNEAIQVQNFIDSAFSLVKAGYVWKFFAKIIPYESYYNGGSSVAIRALTSEERKKYAKERKNYRQQMHLQ
jgi:hypothetical protein